MRRVILAAICERLASFRRPAFCALFGLLAALAAPGCHHEEETRYKSVAKPPVVQLIHPEVRNIVRVVGQPSFIESFERSSVYPKMNAYIQEWKVDIGDTVKKGQTLATLFVPELVEDHLTKGATVKLDEERIELALKVVDVAQADVQAAVARLDEARAELASYRAEVERWDSEVKRLEDEVRRGVVDPQTLLQSTNRLKASTAARDASKATVMKAEAELLSRRAALAKAEVNVRVARADLKVAESEEKRLQAWVGYLVLPAPYDGVIVARNANTFDFVLPTTGDPSADAQVPNLSPSGAAAPIYVVNRTDVVRIFVDIPEQDANYVQIGTKATVLARAYRDQPISGNVTPHLLGAERQEPHAPRRDRPDQSGEPSLARDVRLRQGDHRPARGARASHRGAHARNDNTICELRVCNRVHAKVSALMNVGEKTFCWMYEDGKAKRIEVQTGVTDTKGQWIEVTNYQPASVVGGGEHWTPMTGTEQMILGDLSILTDGSAVEVAQAKNETKVATEKTATPTTAPEKAGPVAVAPVHAP